MDLSDYSYLKAIFAIEKGEYLNALDHFTKISNTVYGEYSFINKGLAYIKIGSLQESLLNFKKTSNPFYQGYAYY